MALACNWSAQCVLSLYVIEIDRETNMAVCVSISQFFRLREPVSNGNISRQ